MFEGWSVIWAMPSILENSGEVGGKVFFGLAQIIAIASMAGSRLHAERETSRAVAKTEPGRRSGFSGSESGNRCRTTYIL